MSQLRRRGGLRSGDFLMVKDTVRASRRRTSRRRSNTVPDLGPDGCGLAGRAHRPHLASVVVALVSILSGHATPADPVEPGPLSQMTSRSRPAIPERHSGDLFVGVQPEAFRRVSQRWGYQLSFQPAMRPPPVSAHIRKPKERGSPAKWRYRKSLPLDSSRSLCVNTWMSAPSCGGAMSRSWLNAAAASWYRFGSVIPVPTKVTKAAFSCTGVK